MICQLDIAFIFKYLFSDPDEIIKTRKNTKTTHTHRPIPQIVTGG